MKRTIAFSAAIFAAVLTFRGLACAQMTFGPDAMMVGGGMMGEPGMGRLPFFLRAADLTPDQRNKVQQILDQHRPAFHKLFEQLHAAREQMNDKLFSTGKVTPADLAASSRQVAQLQQQLGEEEIQVALQIRALLTPAQLKQVADFHQRLQSLHQQIHALFEQHAPPPPAGTPPPG